MSVASDPVAFGTARLDEDEATARAVEDNGAPWDGQWRARDGYLETRSGIVVAVGAGRDFGLGAIAPGVIEHAARHEPARVLREVGAGRRILERHRPDEYGCQACEQYEGVLCPDLRDLLCRWADHPGYDQEWAPR